MVPDPEPGPLKPEGRPLPDTTAPSQSGFERARSVLRSALARLPGATSHEPAERWRRETRRHPDRAPAWSFLADHLAASGREDEALDACRRAIAIDATFANPWNLQGVLEARRGHLDEAVASCRRAVELDPTFALAWANLSTVHALLGQPAKAEEAARQAEANGAPPAATLPPPPTGPSDTGAGTSPVEEIWTDGT